VPHGPACIILVLLFSSDLFGSDWSPFYGLHSRARGRTRAVRQRVDGAELLRGKVVLTVSRGRMMFQP